MKWHVPPKWSSHVGKCPLQPLRVLRSSISTLMCLFGDREDLMCLFGDSSGKHCSLFLVFEERRIKA